MGHPKWKCLGWMNKVYTQGKFVLGIKELPSMILLGAAVINILKEIAQHWVFYLSFWNPKYTWLLHKLRIWPGKWQGVLRAGAGGAGRDNYPGGLGYMPDSQGPNMAKWPIWGQVFLEPRDSPSGVSSPWHPPRKGNNQCTLFIGDFSSSSYPPTYVGISIAIYMYLLVPIDCYISYSW